MTKPSLITARVTDPTTVIDTTIATAISIAPAVSPTKTVLDFEDGALKGLLPTSYFQNSLVPAASMVTYQYINQGITFEHAALANLGVGHAASGKMTIVPVSTSGKVDYDAPVTLHFVKAVDTTVTKTVTQVATSTSYGAVKGNGNSILSNNDDSINHKNKNGVTPVNDHNAEVITTVETKTATASVTSTQYTLRGAIFGF